MTWTLKETQDDIEIGKLLSAQRRLRKKRLLIGSGLLVAALFVTWFSSQVLFSVAADEREYDRWLEQNGCKAVSHREGEWNHHFLGDYWEHIPGETCYECKSVKPFCDGRG